MHAVVVNLPRPTDRPSGGGSGRLSFGHAPPDVSVV